MTIDSYVQEKINQEKKHEKQVYIDRNLVVVKRLGKNNLAFQGYGEINYENNNGVFNK